MTVSPASFSRNAEMFYLNLNALDPYIDHLYGLPTDTHTSHIAVLDTHAVKV